MAANGLPGSEFSFFTCGALFFSYNHPRFSPNLNRNPLYLHFPKIIKYKHKPNNRNIHRLLPPHLPTSTGNSNGNGNENGRGRDNHPLASPQIYICTSLMRRG
jgi:hypothetical protein